MSIEAVLLIVILTFGFGSVLNRWDMRLKPYAVENKKERKLFVFGPWILAPKSAVAASMAPGSARHARQLIDAPNENTWRVKFGKKLDSGRLAPPWS
jgi:hypothetical protein